MQGSLFSFPLPILTAVLCAVIAVLAARLDLGRRQSAVLFSMLFALFALEALLVGLRFGYSVQWFTPLQRLLPVFVGPLMYLPFAALAVPVAGFAKTLMRHLGAAVGIILLLQLLPLRLALGDWLISLSYCFYAFVLLRLWRDGPDRLIYARLGVALVVNRWIIWAVGLLIFILVLDAAIAASFVLQKAGYVAMIISIGTVLIIPFLLGAFFVLPQFVKGSTDKTRPSSFVDDEATKLEAAASELLTTSRLFLDPELSAQRLAKRLHVPVRKLSQAVNDSTGMNMSQYVNGLRLAHAAELLRTSEDSIAVIMAQSGFLTRSNFYREFQRLYGQTPAAFRQGKS